VISRQGSLAVAGAVEDSERTASFIRANLSKIDEIYVSLDTHHVIIEKSTFRVSSLLETAYCAWSILEKFSWREPGSFYPD
jgi:hypothetical protein